MREAAAEEVDHLAWCEQRLKELQGRTSVLNPLWYAGSFALGAFAGALGDRNSLGFIAETEKQVESHLRDHLERLSPKDSRSRAILEQMTQDEMRHGAKAASLGGKPLPFPVVMAMRADVPTDDSRIVLDLTKDPQCLRFRDLCNKTCASTGV